MNNKIGNILLISTPTAQRSSSKSHMPPLGLAYLASSLRKGGFFNIEILDLMLYENYKDKLVEKIRELNPIICGVSFVTPNRFQGFEICKIIKDNSRAIVVTGGPHVSFTAEDTLNNIGYIDIICRGEGEKSLMALAKVLIKNNSNGKLPTSLLREVGGIYFRDNSGAVIFTGAPKFMSVDELSSHIPAYDLLELSKYKVEIPGYEKLKTIALITQRGCPHGCNYCSTTNLWGLTIRPRNVENVIDEIEMLHKDYGYNGFYIFDDCFTFFKKRVLEFCEEVKKRNLNIKWSCSGRVSNLDEELVGAMTAAGCVFLALGVESASQRLLNQMHKGIKIEQVWESKRLCEKYGLAKKYWFIFGHPTETKAELKQTIKIINRLSADITARGFMRIFPGTEMEKIAKMEGVLPNGFSWSKPYRDPKTKFLTNNSDPNIYYVPNSLIVENLRDAAYAPLIFSGDFLNPFIVIKRLRKVNLRRSIYSFVRHFGWYFKKIFERLSGIIYSN